MSAPKVVCQLRRAKKLRAWLVREYPGDWPMQIEVARRLTPQAWAAVAHEVDIDPPSDDTIALTVELLEPDPAEG